MIFFHGAEQVRIPRSIPLKYPGRAIYIPPRIMVRMHIRLQQVYAELEDARTAPKQLMRLEGSMGNPENTADRQSEHGTTSMETYLGMNEQEKDIEIQKAVDRLQKRIQAILYALDADSHRTSLPHSGEQTENRS